MMSEGKGVYSALAAAQGEFPVIAKTHTAKVFGEDKNGNKISYTYGYADLGDIVSSIRPMLYKHKLAIAQPIIIRDNGSLVLRTAVIHADGSEIASEIPLPAPIGKPQAFGSALTYMRRYALASLLGIASEEDDDGSAAEQPGEVTRSQRPAQKEGYRNAVDRPLPGTLNKLPAKSNVDPLDLAGCANWSERIDTLEKKLASAKSSVASYELWQVYRDRVREPMEKTFPGAWQRLDDFVAKRIEAEALPADHPAAAN
jgi:hypothetical protein